jgi:hypothetical protein
MHAKRTRDRKKQLVEVSEAMIGQMENESHALREYLVSLKLLSVEEAEKSKERASESQKELAALKVHATPELNDFKQPFCLLEALLILIFMVQASQNEYDLDGDDDDDDDHFNDDNGDGDDEHDGSLSGSDDNEKGSWSGSNNGNDSINGDTSGDGTASTGSNNSSSHNAPSSSGSSRSHNSSGSGSGSGSDSPTLKHTKMEWSKTEQKPCAFNYGSKQSGGFKVGAAPPCSTTSQVGVAYSSRTSGSKKSQSVESYNHGGMVPVNEEANAVEIANYLGYSHQQAQEKHLQPPTAMMIAPASVVTSHALPPLSIPPSALEINATLSVVDFYQEKTQQDQNLPASWRYPPLRPIATTQNASTHTSQNMVVKVPNILLSVIPQGILSPRSSGGVSPRGTFSPIETAKGIAYLHNAPMYNPSCASPAVKIDCSNASRMSCFSDSSKSQTMHLSEPGQFRNLPSSNIANGNSPL